MTRGHVKVGGEEGEELSEAQIQALLEAEH